MVKTDYTHDYYADLELTQTADADEIKKQFRHLALKYHPDRHPGEESDFVPKFQAVQAAHEIFSDPAQKAKYDAERAKRPAQNSANAQVFRRNPHPPPPPATQFPPPPRRATTGARGGGFNPTPGRGAPPSSSGAEKYDPFMRAGAQPWAKAKDEAQAKADAMRGFNSMRTGPNPGYPTPPPPMRQPGYPTASYTAGNAPPVNGPRMQPSFEQFSPQPGFPGMARTTSAQKPRIYTPGGPGFNESTGPSASAYFTYMQGQRPHAGPWQSYGPEGSGPTSPHAAFREPATSPLRHVQSTPGLDEPSRKPDRSVPERFNTQYHQASGERTYPGRSASVRTSPVERTHPDYEGNRGHRPHSHHGAHISRHHSASPKLRPTSAKFDFDSSESESSTTEQSEEHAGRRKAQPHSRRHETASNPGEFAFRHVVADDPALTGQFPPANYHKTPSPRDEFTSHYRYPPPPPRAFTQTSPTDSHSHASMNGDGRVPVAHVSPGAQRDHPNMYGPFPSPRKSRSQDWGLPSLRYTSRGPSLNGFPSWAVPSSVLPQRRPRLGTVQEKSHIKRPDLSSNSTYLVNADSFSKADAASCASFPAPDGFAHRQHPQPNVESVSQANISSTFSAADWDGKFNSGDEFRPTMNMNGDRRSPTHPSRPRARSHGEIRTTSPGTSHATIYGHKTTFEDTTGVPIGHAEGPEISKSRPTEQAFQPGKFSADEWVEKLKDQTWSIPSSDLNNGRSKTPKRPSKSNPPRRPIPASKSTTLDDETTSRAPNDTHTQGRPVNGDVDPMDIDDSLSDSAPFSTPINNEQANADRSGHPHAHVGMNDVDLNSFANVTPFAPSSTGLKDLNDLSTNLPFESRAARKMNLNPNPSGHSSRDLRLPTPPKPIPPLTKAELNQPRWDRYIFDMKAYLSSWNNFNKQMIEHFRSRQEQIDTSMADRWMSMIGDGPRPDSEDRAKGGYATYMGWLEDEMKYRERWNVANEEHRKCCEDLGRVREMVKAAIGAAGS